MLSTSPISLFFYGDSWWNGRLMVGRGELLVPVVCSFQLLEVE